MCFFLVSVFFIHNIGVREHAHMQATVKMSVNDYIFVTGDFNGHAGRKSGIFNGV